MFFVGCADCLKLPFQSYFCSMTYPTLKHRDVEACGGWHGGSSMTDSNRACYTWLHNIPPSWLETTVTVMQSCRPVSYTEKAGNLFICSPSLWYPWKRIRSSVFWLPILWKAFVIPPFFIKQHLLFIMTKVHLMTYKCSWPGVPSHVSLSNMASSWKSTLLWFRVLAFCESCFFSLTYYNTKISMWWGSMKSELSPPHVFTRQYLEL